MFLQRGPLRNLGTHRGQLWSAMIDISQGCEWFSLKVFWHTQITNWNLQIKNTHIQVVEHSLLPWESLCKWKDFHRWTLDFLASYCSSNSLLMNRRSNSSGQFQAIARDMKVMLFKWKSFHLWKCSDGPKPIFYIWSTTNPFCVCRSSVRGILPPLTVHSYLKLFSTSAIGALLCFLKWTFSWLQNWEGTLGKFHFQTSVVVYLVPFEIVDQGCQTCRPWV